MVYKQLRSKSEEKVINVVSEVRRRACLAVINYFQCEFRKVGGSLGYHLRGLEQWHVTRE